MTIQSKQITANELNHEHMRNKPEAFQVSLELNINGLNLQEREILKKYGKMKNGITRDLIVPADITLHGLHYAIQRSFGWENSHLHCFRLKKDVFQKMTGGENRENHYGYCEYDGKLQNWISLCGLYFRYPTDDFEDLYWDDDYDDAMNFRTWMRRKYTGPYQYNGNWEHYSIAHNAAKKLIRNDSDRTKTIQDIRMNFMGGAVDELIERIPLQHIVVPYDISIDEDTFKKVKILAEIQEQNASVDLSVFPVSDELIYEYDFGDGWEVDIRVTDCYNTDSFDEVIDDTTKQSIYNMNNEKMNEEMTNNIFEVIQKHRPVCIKADGLPVMDDVGGVHGYVEFLNTIHDIYDEEREYMRDWGSMMGWTGRAVKPKNIL